MIEGQCCRHTFRPDESGAGSASAVRPEPGTVSNSAGKIETIAALAADLRAGRSADQRGKQFVGQPMTRAVGRGIAPGKASLRQATAGAEIGGTGELNFTAATLMRARQHLHALLHLLLLSLVRSLPERRRKPRWRCQRHGQHNGQHNGHLGHSMATLVGERTFQTESPIAGGRAEGPRQAGIFGREDCPPNTSLVAALQTLVKPTLPTG